MATVNQVIEGLKILSKYSEDNTVCAGHEIIYAGSGVSEDDISEEDQVLLEDLGWHFDTSCDSWARFT